MTVDSFFESAKAWLKFLLCFATLIWGGSAVYAQDGNSGALYLFCLIGSGAFIWEDGIKRGELAGWIKAKHDQAEAKGSSNSSST